MFRWEKNRKREVMNGWIRQWGDGPLLSNATNVCEMPEPAFEWSETGRGYIMWRRLGVQANTKSNPAERHEENTQRMESIYRIQGEWSDEHSLVDAKAHHWIMIYWGPEFCSNASNSGVQTTKLETNTQNMRRHKDIRRSDTIEEHQSPSQLTEDRERKWE